MSFEDIRAHMSDSGAKSDASISEALAALPIRVALMLTAREAASFVQNWHDAKREVYLRATR